MSVVTTNSGGPRMSGSPTRRRRLARPWGLALLLGACLAPGARAANGVSVYVVDYLRWVSPSADIVYGFRAILSGSGIQSVSVTVPGGETLNLAYYNSSGSTTTWFLQVNVSANFSDVTNRFAPGACTFNVTYTDTSTAHVTANLATGTFPPDPVISSPALGAEIQESQALTIQWSQWQSTNDPAKTIGLNVWDSLRDATTPGYAANGFPTPTTQTIIAAGTLADRKQYELTVEFAQNLADHGRLCTFQEWNFNTGPAISAYYLQLNAAYFAWDNPGHTFVAALAGTTIQSVTLTAPNGPTYPLVYQDGQWEYQSASFDAYASLIVVFPAGTYIYHITFNDLTVTQKTAQLVTDSPPPKPLVTSPCQGSVVGAAEPLLIAWDQWQAAPDPTRSVLASVTDLHSGSVVYPVTGTDANSSQQIVAVGALAAQNLYQCSVVFQYQPNDHCVLNAALATDFGTGGGETTCQVSLYYDATRQWPNFEAEAFGTMISGVLLTTPLGEAIEIPWNPDLDHSWTQGWTLYYEAPTLAEVTARFPDGTYTFDIRYWDGTQERMTAALSGAMPPAPVFTQPASPSIVDPSLPLSVQWVQWEPAPQDYLWIQYWVEDANGATVYGSRDGSLNLACDATTFTVPAGVLQSDQTYDIHLRFGYCLPGVNNTKMSESCCTVYTQAKGLQEWHLQLVKGRLANDQDVGAVLAQVAGSDIRAAVVRSPSGYDFALSYHSNQDNGTGTWERQPHSYADLLTAAQFATQCPDGDYTFTVTYGDNSTTQKVVTVGGTYPPLPNFAAPLNHGTVNDRQPLNVAWDQWLSSPSAGQSIQFKMDAPNGDDVYGTDPDLSADARTARVPVGRLSQSQSYELVVFFISTADAAGHAFKGAMRQILVQTLDHVSVKSVTPATGSTAGGTAVTICGNAFWPGATVTFGGVPVTGVVVLDAVSLTCTTPARSPGTADVMLTNPDGSSATAPGAFTYTGTPPKVDAVTPALGSMSGGQAVTITGSNFPAVLGSAAAIAGTQVTFGGVAASAVVVQSGTQLTCVTPAHVPATVDVAVTTTEGSDVRALAYTFFADCEGDVSPRASGGDGAASIADWVQVGRFAAALDTAVNGPEFQKADCAPRETNGDGIIGIADWVQAGRFAAKLDDAQPAGGPPEPTP